jgi:transcriptional regulator with XRE-family HTH domain
LLALASKVSGLTTKFRAKIMNSLKLREENCSPFGRLILQYLKDHPQTNMNQLAKQIGISHAGLSWVCLKRSGPDEETARKVAQVIGIDLTKIARLVYENKLERLATLNGLNYVAHFGRDTITRPLPKEDAIAGLNAIFHAFHYVIRSVPDQEKPTDFQIYKLAHEVIRRQFLKSGKSLKKPKPEATN